VVAVCQRTVAKVNVAADWIYICKDRDALNIANDHYARERIGDLNVMQILTQGGCIQANRGMQLRIRGLSDKKSATGIVVSPSGKVGRMIDFTGWYGMPLLESSLHFACRTPSGITFTNEADAPRGESYVCGLQTCRRRHRA
jgi:hypothetical protein